MKKDIYLICNAHIDPVWQWGWEEGAAAAVSTFSAAADFCEEYDEFVFNHNEALLYEWVKEYAPELFERIKRLVKAGKWHIMGGWYLQPDCNMPSGESFIRQIISGLDFFKKEFGARPKVAVNFDSFGHSRGLVQILKKSGFDSYVYMRPEGENVPQNTDFIWEGFDGSEIVCHKIFGAYNSLIGDIDKKVERYKENMESNGDREIGFVPWGVGNHGGGPSRLDLDKLREMQKTDAKYNYIHATPEMYFEHLKKNGLQRIKSSLNPKFVGCYTSLITVKQKHREVENLYYSVEKTVSAAAAQGLMQYPKQELGEALKNLLMSEFHDILPGTCVEKEKEYALDILGHSTGLLSKLRMRAFFALLQGQKPAEKDTYPIFIYNHHSFKKKNIYSCEFMLANQNWSEYFYVPQVYYKGKKVPCQLEKESSTFNLDWRKKVVFEAELDAGSMNRFDCIFVKAKERPIPSVKPINDKFVFDTEKMHIEISTVTGLIEAFSVDGENMLGGGAFGIEVYKDNADPWRMDTNRFDDYEGKFELMSPEEGADFCGIENTASIRVTDDGEVRSVVEAYFKYKDSKACVTYKLPKHVNSFDIEVRINSSLKNRMFKLAVPTSIADGAYYGNTAFGVDTLKTNGEECVSQKWIMASNGTKALSVINNGIYGSSCENGTLKLSLMRTSGYCVHPIGERPLFPTNRYYTAAEQGNRCFQFRIIAGKNDEVKKATEQEALIFNEQPFALSAFPVKNDKPLPKAGVTIEGEGIYVSAFKKCEEGNGYILRVYEPIGEKRYGRVIIESLNMDFNVELSPFEVKTFKVENGKVIEVTMTEGL